MEEKTKAQQLIEVANWVKNQNPEFTKHFKTMRSIIKFYLQLPDGYDKQKSVVAFINKGLKSKDYLVRGKAERLSLIINTLFGFRYFTGAPAKWSYYFSFRSWKNPRNGEEYMEVRCTPTDRCNVYDDFKECTFGTHTVSIKTLGDAKRAADKILEDMVKHRGDDYNVVYSEKLKEAMKSTKPSNEELEIGIEVGI